MDPLVLQDVVESVFRDHGCDVRASAHQNDGGIDIVLVRDGEEVAVQVKRTKNVIEAEQVRPFIGALVEGHKTRGIYVTTSSFRRGARKSTQAAASEGRYVELMDGDGFLRALGVAQEQSWSPDPRDLLEIVGTRCHYRGSTFEAPFPAVELEFELP